MTVRWRRVPMGARLGLLAPAELAEPGCAQGYGNPIGFGYGSTPDAAISAAQAPSAPPGRRAPCRSGSRRAARPGGRSAPRWKRAAFGRRRWRARRGAAGLVPPARPWPGPSPPRSSLGCPGATRVARPWCPTRAGGSRGRPPLRSTAPPRARPPGARAGPYRPAKPRRGRRRPAAGASRIHSDRLVAARTRPAPSGGLDRPSQERQGRGQAGPRLGAAEVAKSRRRG